MNSEFDFRLLKNILSPDTLIELETSYLAILKMQADKLGIQQPTLPTSASGILVEIDNLVFAVNKISHDALGDSGKPSQPARK